MLSFFLNQEKIYAGYNLKGKVNSTSYSFTAPVSSMQAQHYTRKLCKNKYLFMQGLPPGIPHDARHLMIAS